VYQVSEIVDLIMAVFLTPIMFTTFRRLRLAGKRWFLVGYAAMLVGYVATIGEGYYLPDALNLTEHIAYAVSGIGFLGGLWSVLVESRGGRAE
jgi:uncharacterized membrane protein YhiD involved in acid resistance